MNRVTSHQRKFVKEYVAVDLVILWMRCADTSARDWLSKQTQVCWRTKTYILPYSLPSVWPGADPDVRQSALRLPLLSARPAVTFPAEERPLPSTSTKLYCLVTEAHKCEQLAQGCYATSSRWKLNPRPSDSKVRLLTLAPQLRHLEHCSLTSMRWHSRSVFVCVNPYNCRHVDDPQTSLSHE